MKKNQLAEQATSASPEKHLASPNDFVESALSKGLNPESLFNPPPIVPVLVLPKLIPAAPPADSDEDLDFDLELSDAEEQEHKVSRRVEPK